MRIALAMKTAAIAVMASLAISACTAGNGHDSGNKDKEDTLHLALNTPPTSFAIGEWAGGEQYLATAVYDTIVTLAPTVDKFQPGIAEAWEYNTDRTRLTLNIRKGMTFTDGAPVDAAAVVASLEAARKGPASSQSLASVSAVEATDESTVLVELSRPDGALLYNLSTSVGSVGSPKVLTAESSKLEPVGSGPYVLDKEATKVGDIYVLVRNEDHWNAEAYPFERVEAKLLQDSAAARNAFRAGQVDVYGEKKEALKQYAASQFNQGEAPPGNMAALWLVDREGKVVPALADQRVRLAINMAFDRESIAKNLVETGDGATNQVFSPISETFDKELLDKTPYDVKRARELMAEAGYADGFNVTMPSNFATTTYEPIVSQALSEIGITVNWEPVPFQDFFAKVFGGSYGMFFMFSPISGIDAKDADAALNGAFNPFQSTTPKLQELIAAANAAPEDKQTEAYRAINEYFVDQAWFAPLSSPSGFWVSSKDLKTVPLQGVPSINLLGYEPAG
ncbi:ABC transporter substrate-binding protein [Pseudarthrobacter sp. R1]|uniref:ABC transporter substrate-binding protein n=1 Tax=Pseudarthrobacter sp. R1 TaxID=2944934 RepID=UPI00210D07F9|nr:ABC transporter substrate-binding protein [Pseudarthrobacter sp. R1]MCQ6271446.1 ABC transporter substrate-binding protein [Pseudarthrobacter sp. R1]